MNFEAIAPRFGGGVSAGKIRIFDTTLRDGEQAPGAGLTVAEKIEVARQLARLRVDVIEAGFPAASPGDFEAVQRIAAETRGIAVAGLSSHYCLSNAFRAGDATLVVPLDFMRIPLIAVVGWALYGERLDIFVLLGALIIVASVLWNLRAESRRFR